MYPLFSDTRGKDAMIDWQFKIMDYVTNQLENVSNGAAVILLKKSFISIYTLNVKFGVLSVVGAFGLYLRC